MVFYTEDYVTMHLEPLLQCLYKAVRDEQDMVGKEVSYLTKIIFCLYLILYI